MSMLAALRQRNPAASLIRILWWSCFCRLIAWFAVAVGCRYRWWGSNHIPRTGGVLLLCNHQSYLDLIVVGAGIGHRHFHSMARASLFRHPAFAWLIRSLNAFPVDQGKGDLKALRRAIELLKAGNLVLVFPEGSRTLDGKLAPFAEGIMLLIRRAKPTVVPAAVDGVYDVWSLHRPLPRLGGMTGAAYGEPIDAETLLAMKEDQAVAFLREQTEQLRLQVRARLRRASRGEWPPPSLGDRHFSHFEKPQP